MEKTIKHSDSNNSETAKKTGREKLVEITLFKCKNFTPYKDAATTVLFTSRSVRSQKVCFKLTELGELYQTSNYH